MKGINCNYKNREITCGSLQIRPVTISLPKEGDNTIVTGIEGHTHDKDHTTIIINGAVRATLSKDGVVFAQKDFKQGDMFLAKADVVHALEALEDDTVAYCIFSRWDDKGQESKEFALLDEITGWE